MRVLLGTFALLTVASCDPPPPSYAQYRYGADPQAPDPNAPPPGVVTTGAPPPAGAPPATYTVNPSYTTTQIQPGYTSTQVPSNAPTGAPAPSGPYTTTQIRPGYTSTAPAPAPPAPAPLAPGPDVSPPVSSAPMPAGSIPAGPYACYQVGLGGYVASNLISVLLNPDSTYAVTGYKGGGGSFRADTVTLYLSSGPLNGWVGAIGANAKGPLVRFRPDVPNNPGREVRQGDQICFLHF